MKILVTGGCGFIGTNLIKQLLKDDHTIVSLDNYSTGTSSNEHSGCRYYDVDDRQVKDYSFFMTKPDIVFHLAALARIQPSLKAPSETVYNNVISTLNVLEYARKNNIKVIYAGSSSFHQGTYRSPYAWSKYGGEELCTLYTNVYDLDTVICRFYNVYGFNQIEEGTYATVIGRFEYQYRNNKPLTIVGDGTQKRDFTHINDIVNALVLCIDHKFKADILELGRGINFSINDIADMFGKNYSRIYLPKQKGEYDKTLCDYSYAKEILGWEPTKNLDEYIEKITNDKN